MPFEDQISCTVDFDRPACLAMERTESAVGAIRAVLDAVSALGDPDEAAIAPHGRSGSSTRRCALGPFFEPHRETELGQCPRSPDDRRFELRSDYIAVVLVAEAGLGRAEEA
jgi:hypothetical protein